MSDVDEKPKVDQQITIKILDTSGQELHFKVKQSTKLSKVFKAFLERKGYSSEHIRFFLDGTRLKTTCSETPADLQMEDGDQIDARVEQEGGC